MKPTRIMTIAEYRVALKKSPRKQAGKVNNHTELVKAVVDRLNMIPGVDAIPMNTGEIHREGVHVKFGFKGMADVMVRVLATYYPPWRTLWLEVKTGTGRQKPDQQAFQELVQKWGDRYIIVRTIDDAEKAVGENNR